jgi:hypothetical protein
MALHPAGMLGAMTESTGPQAEPTTTASRWGDRPNRPHMLFKLAALVVIAAGTVFIFAVVLWTGIFIGAHGSGHERHHEGHEGQHWRQSEMTENGPSTTSAPATSAVPSQPRP